MVNGGTQNLAQEAGICRTCLNASSGNTAKSQSKRQQQQQKPKQRKLLSIFSKLGDAFIANIITDYTAVQIDENDGLPSEICTDCYEIVKLLDAFGRATRESDAKLRQQRRCKTEQIWDVSPGPCADDDDDGGGGDTSLVEPMHEEEEKEGEDTVLDDSVRTVTHFLEIKFESSDQMMDETVEEVAEQSDNVKWIDDDTDNDWKENDKEERGTKKKKLGLKSKPTPTSRKRSGSPRPRKRISRVPLQSEEDMQLSERELELFTVIEIPPKSHICCGCLKIYETAEELEDHRKESHVWKNLKTMKMGNKVCCEGCLRKFNANKNIEQHKERIRLLKAVWECKKCKLRFKAAYKRREHAKLHPEGEPDALIARIRESTREEFGWVCCGPKCGESFDTEANLIAHGLSSHWIDKQKADLECADKPEQCQICFQRFSNPKQIFSHQRRMYKFSNFPCALCEMKFFTSDDLNIHEVKIHGKDRFKCELCGKSFLRKLTLETHILAKHTPGAPPQVRKWKPKRILPLQKEEDLQLNEEEQELFTAIAIPPGSYVCCGCLQYFESPEELELHRKTNHVWKNDALRQPTSKQECVGCLRQFATARGISFHKERIGLLRVVWECNKCQIRFKLVGKRREHAKLHPEGEPVALVARVRETTKKEFGWVCCGRKCTQSFASEAELIAHGQSSHWIEKQEADLKYAYMPVQCKVCFKRFVNQKQIFNHQRRKYKFKNFQCTQCGLTFLNRTDLEKHEVKEHGNKSFSCEICGKNYTSKRVLDSHIKVMHLQEKQHQCTICGNTFRQRVGLTVHMNMHIDVPQYRCEICSKMFKAKQHLRNHMRTHTGEKPYQCQYCTSAFADHNNWKRHEMTHTGDRPHKCSYCEKSFILRRTLLDHEASHTGSGGEPRPNRKTMQPAVSLNQHATRKRTSQRPNGNC